MKYVPNATHVPGKLMCFDHMGKYVKSLSHVRLFVTQWTAAHQALQSMGFSRQEYWSGLPFPSPGDLPDPGIKPRSPALEADALTSEPPGKISMYKMSNKDPLCSTGNNTQCFIITCI